MNIEEIWFSLTEKEKQKVIDIMNTLLTQMGAAYIVRDVIKRNVAILKEAGMTESAVRNVLDVFV